MNGMVELHKACSKHNVKPIFGCEIYMVDDHTARGPGRVERNHLTLLAANDTGYRNLVQLSSAGFLDGLHRGKPTLDLAQIERRSEGIIALTGCLASRFCQRLLDDRPADARAHADELRVSSVRTASTSRFKRMASPRRRSATRGSCASPGKWVVRW